MTDPSDRDLFANVRHDSGLRLHLAIGGIDRDGFWRGVRRDRGERSIFRRDRRPVLKKRHRRSPEAIPVVEERIDLLDHYSANIQRRPVEARVENPERHRRDAAGDRDDGLG